MYKPQEDDMDFEMELGSIMGKLKKGLGKVGNAVFVKPSEKIGGMIGGKKGAKIGRMLGKGAMYTTGAAAAAPLLASPTVHAAALTGGTIMAGKKLLGGKGKAKAKAKAKGKAKAKAKGGSSCKKSDCASTNAMAARVAADLVKRFGGPLGEINRALAFADTQRQATYEHQRLMSDSEFRRKVLGGIALQAGNGNPACERTIRVIMGRA